MIFSKNGHVKIKGNDSEITADATCILRVLYQTYSDEYGKETANEKLVGIGRLAVMTDEEIIEDVKKMIMDLAVR